MGLSLRSQGGAVTVANALPGGPALAAGVLRGDVVLSVDGAPLAGTDLTPILERHQPGDRVPVRVRRGTEEIDLEVTLAGGGNLRWEIRPMADPDERQLRLREGWLASQVGR
jgi:putative serine protease PepD